MHYHGWGSLCMHFFWWLFWIALIEPVPRGRRRETPLEVLQRRYAAGEI